MTSYPNYQEFTADNFLCETVSASASKSTGTYTVNGNWWDSKTSTSGSYSYTKSYDATTGILTITTVGKVTGSFNHGNSVSATWNATYKAYLIA